MHGGASHIVHTQSMPSGVALVSSTLKFVQWLVPVEKFSVKLKFPTIVCNSRDDTMHVCSL